MLSGAGVARLVAGEERIVVTGAGGWLGLATIDLLRRTLGSKAFEARVRCFGSAERVLYLADGTTVSQAPLAGLAMLTAQPTIVLHNAFLTKDKAECMDDAAFISGNLAIRAALLGALDTIGATAIFVPSSGAARTVDDPAASAAMRLYGRMKAEDEQAFAGWAERGGHTAVIARVFNLSGPYINKPEAYALASFIVAAQAGRPIEVHAPRPVLRSYVAIRELMSVVFALLTAAPPAVTRFDTRGRDVLELVEVATAVAATVAPVPVIRAPLTTTSADDYVGDPFEYEALRARFSVPAVTLPDQIDETAAYLAGRVAT